MLVADGAGTPIGLLVESARGAEVRLAEPTLATVRVARPRDCRRARPVVRPVRDAHRARRPRAGGVGQPPRRAGAVAPHPSFWRGSSVGAMPPPFSECSLADGWRKVSRLHALPYPMVTGEPRPECQRHHMETKPQPEGRSQAEAASPDTAPTPKAVTQFAAESQAGNQPLSRMARLKGRAPTRGVGLSVVALAVSVLSVMLSAASAYWQFFYKPDAFGLIVEQASIERAAHPPNPDTSAWRDVAIRTTFTNNGRVNHAVLGISLLISKSSNLEDSMIIPDTSAFNVAPGSLVMRSIRIPVRSQHMINNMIEDGDGRKWAQLGLEITTAGENGARTECRYWIGRVHYMDYLNTPDVFPDTRFRAFDLLDCFFLNDPPADWGR